MPKVVSLALHGLDLWFNSDEHLLKALARAVEANREALLTEWEAKVSVKAPGAAR